MNNRGSLKLPLAAVAEVSLQVPNGRTATPFPLPLWVKRVSFGSVPQGAVEKLYIGAYFGHV